MVTLLERQKAAKLFQQQKANNAVGSKASSPVKQKKDKLFDDSLKGFSKGEKDLYKAVEKIKERERQKTITEEEKTKDYFEKKIKYNGIPVPNKKLENKLKFGQNTEEYLVEWEKNWVKPLWKEFDKDKKGVQKAKLVDIMARLATDECCIGKVPAVD